jgi:16S rRNA (cytosine1402-N4)-methyltransferase
VNDELAGLERLLRALPWCLRPGGRAGFLSFHSGEDRRVKRALRDGLEAGLYEAVADEVVRASPSEVARNPRAGPAKFRWARRAPT